MMRHVTLLALAAVGLPGAGPARPDAIATPADIAAAAPASAWAEVDPGDVFLMDLAGGRRIILVLAPDFAPAHVANVRALARAGWFDGASIERVQDNYVTQWGDPDGRRPLPAGVAAHPPAEYERSSTGLGIVPLASRDSFAPRVGFVRMFPVAGAGDRAWMAHCYGVVGVGRDMPPDTGSGAELYAVIGHAPRHLDRNLAMVGRVVMGMDALAAMPRGAGALGMYADPGQRMPIVRARLAADVPASDRPRVEWLRPESASFRAWVAARAARRDPFFVRPARAIDLCNAMPPVRVSGAAAP